MANNSELTIVLKLLDDATSGIKKALGEAGNETDKLKKKNKEANKTIQDNFHKSTQGVRQFRRDLTLVIGILYSVVNATREYAKYSDEARQSVNDFDKSVQKMAINAGKVLMPVLKILEQTAEGWAMITNVAGNLMEGKGFVLDVNTDNVDAAITASQKLKDITDQQKLLNEGFLAGNTTAITYFDNLISSESTLLQIKQQQMTQLQQIAVLSTEINNQQLLEGERVSQEQIKYLQTVKDTHMTAMAGMMAFTTMLSESIQNNLSGSLTSIITGTKKAKEAFADLGNAMIQSIVDFMMQKVVAFLLEKTLLANHVAASTSAAAAVAAAWAPAAVAVNIASFGAAGIAAAASAMTAGISTAMSMGIAAGAGTLKKGVEVSIQSGVGGAGPLGGGGFAVGTPRVPYDMTARIHKNEMIVPADFAEGIRRGDLSLGGGIGDINVNVYYPKMTAKEEIAELARALGFEISRELRYARGA